jgi:glycosyltransferase involved in cell wall biosynthesis
MSAYDSASALVHFPLEESFGLVVAEALARNLKVFVSKTGGLVDIIDGVPEVEAFEIQDLNGLRLSLSKWIQCGCPPATNTNEPMRLRYHPERVAELHLQIYREVLKMSS